jgi:Spy/CpxP family protein refolding chaperone
MWKTTRFGMLGFAVLLFLPCSVAVRAQDAGTSKAQAQTEAGPHQGQHANHLEWLSKELNLTDDQKAQVKPILDEQSKQMRATQEDTSLTQEQKHEKMKQIHQSTHSQINQLLTPEQQKKFAEMKEQHKGQREGSKENPSEQPKQPY